MVLVVDSDAFNFESATNELMLNLILEKISKQKENIGGGLNAKV